MIPFRREKGAKGPPGGKIKGLRIWAGALALMALVAGGAEGTLSSAPPLFFTHPLHLGMEVYSLLQDRDGFLWIVTAHAGVAKYDGQKVHFLKEGPQGLSTNTVVAALEDRRGRIWIATAGGGLNVYDKDTNSVRVFRHREGDPYSLNSDTFSYKNHGNQVLLEDRAGGLWCGTLRGVSRLESDDRRGVFFTPVPFADGVPRTVYALLEDRRGKIWVGTDRGLSRLDPSKGVIETWTVGSLGELEGKAIFCLLEDRDGNLWAGGDSGLHGLLASGGMRHIPPGDPESGLPDMAIHSLTEDPRGGLILGSDLGFPGLWRWNPVSGRCTVHRHDAGDVRSLGSSSLAVRATLWDRQGTLWVLHGTGKLDGGTSSGGPFRIWRREKDSSKGIAADVVGGLVRDEEGILWIATFEGLDRYDPEKDSFRRFCSSPGREGVLPHRAATALGKDRRDRLWVGSPAGIALFDRASGEVVRHTATPTVYAICPDAYSDDILWLGTMDRGLLRYDASFGTWRALAPDLPSAEERRVHGKVWSVVKDRDHPELLWMPIFGGGIDRFDTRRELWDHWPREGLSPDGRGSKKVTAILQDRRGRFWVATADRGLLSFDRDRGTFHPVSPEGLSGGNPIWSLEEDLRGRLWMGTDGGLVCFDADRAEVRTFSLGEGLPSESFLRRSAATEDGTLWFMTTEGMVSVSPDALERNSTPPPVYLSALRRYGVPLSLDRAPERLQELTLRWPENSFEFDFVALNYLFPEKNRYAYKLEGLDDRWFDAGDRGTGRYVALPGGTYVLRMKASNNDGVWSPEGASLRVTVVPPFWERDSFALAVGGSFLGGIALLWFWRIRQVRARELDLATKVHRRTAQLAAANNRLQKEIADRRRAEEALRRALVTDELTGLLNRRGFYERAQEMEAQARELSRALFLVYMDMDNFKEINDGFGHGVGDEALREMASLISGVFGDGTIRARLGGDEFAVLGMADDRDHFGPHLVGHFRNVLEERNALTPRPYRLEPSLGTALGSGDLGEVELLVRRADDAMYEEKMARRLRRLKRDRPGGSFSAPAAPEG